MKLFRFIVLCVLFLIPVASIRGQSSTLSQVVETTDQGLSVRAPASWLGADVLEFVPIPLYDHALVVAENQSVLESVALVSLGDANPNTINGKGGFFVSINRQVFLELTGEPGTAVNVFALALLFVQQQGYAYEGPIEYQLGDTTAYAIAVYYGTTASFSMLFERGGLLMGGDLYTNNPNPVEDVPLFLEMFNSLVAPSENRQLSQNMNMLGGLTNQQPPTTNQQPPPVQPTTAPVPTAVPATGNAGPMLTQLQGQQPPPPPPAVVNDDGFKPVASLNGRFETVVPQDWVLLDNAQSEIELELFLTNSDTAVLDYLRNGAPLPNGVAYIQVLVVSGNFSPVSIGNLFEEGISLLPEGASVSDERYDIELSGYPSRLALWWLGQEIGLVSIVNFNNSAMAIIFRASDEATYDSFFDAVLITITSILYQN